MLQAGRARRFGFRTLPPPAMAFVKSASRLPGLVSSGTADDGTAAGPCASRCQRVLGVLRARLGASSAGGGCEMDLLTEERAEALWQQIEQLHEPRRREAFDFVREPFPTGWRRG